MKIGEIYWVELPDADGREQKGRRPAVIFQQDSYGSSLPTLLVIPLSSTKAALRFPGTALIRATTDSGLKNDSVALVFQLRAIDRGRIIGQLGKVHRGELSTISEELQKLTRESP